MILKVCHFYKWQLEEVLEMDIGWFYKAVEATDIIQNQLKLDAMEACSFPNLKPESQKAMHKKVFSRAWPDIFESKRQVSISDLARILKGK